jgi:TolB-like protein/Tfp pilus assembly protein PilF
MSPEQLNGEELDHRTDLFSFGIMLYEMATGQRPFQGKTSASITSSILRDTPRPVQELNGVLPRHLGRIIERCLAKDPEQRLQSAKDIRNDLRALLKEVDSGSDFSEPLSARHDIRFEENLVRLAFPDDAPERDVESWKPEQIRLVVLPFENLSNDAEQVYFSDGMTEEMITRLGRLRPELLGVIARTSAMRYKKTDKPIDQIGRELGVTYVIEGGVRRSGNSVRINAQLIQVSDQTQLWGDSYTRDLSDVFAIQAEVAEAVAEALEVELLPQTETAHTNLPTTSEAAYDAYLLGRSYWTKRTPVALYTATKKFKRAIQLDPNYALAYSGLADTWAVLPWYVPGPYNAINGEAKKAAEKALALNDSLAEPHVSMGRILRNRGKLEPADYHYRKAVVIDPNNATAHQWYGLLLGLQGRHDAARKEFERAIALDPLSAAIRLDYGAAMMVTRRFDKAIQQTKKAQELQPDLYNAAYVLMWAYNGKGDQKAAASSFENFMTLLGEPANRVATFHQTCETSGLRSAILGWLALFGACVQAPGFGFPGKHASLLAWCNEKDRAFELLGRALVQQDPILVLVATHPAFDNLRDDPRFDDLLRKIGLDKVDLPAPTTTP